ncbi:MAG: carbohydrate binding domain-containing protein [Oscillospiraceae bacterium]|nr:carbohydrate binding domain-containing protein [Oscillospiraceae bacterium]
MKKQLSALLSLVIATCSVSMSSFGASDTLLKADFESGLNGWSNRGTATVEVTQEIAASGNYSASVTNRSSAWCGIGHTLDTSVFQPGTAYSFQAQVTQLSTPMSVHFKMSLQYNTGGMGSDVYDAVAEADVGAGMWSTLSNPSYTIPTGAQNLTLYIETENSTTDFFVDNIIVAAEGVSSGNFKLGDVDHSGKINAQDPSALQAYLLTKTNDGVYADTADFDANSKLNAIDLTMLKRSLLREPDITTTPYIETEPTETTVYHQGGDHTNPKEYMESVRSKMTLNVPANVKATNTGGDVEHITYYSKKAGHDKPANVWTPKGYSPSQKYCVLYMNHGVTGGEGDMVSGWGITEMASYFIDSGEVPPFIIVFTQMYTDPSTVRPGGMNFNMDMMDHYDDFYYDLTESLMPYIEQNYSIKTGKENTAIAGFSMGGRESLYLAITAPDKFGYVAASSPAPGIVPASDNFIPQHLGSYIPGTNRRMTEADFKISDDKLPYLLMIGGGTNDPIVGTFPKQYHELFQKNGTDHIWMEVQGAGHDAGVGTPLFYNFFRALFKA